MRSSASKMPAASSGRQPRPTRSCASCRIRRTRLRRRPRNRCRRRRCRSEELLPLAAGLGQTWAIAGNAVARQHRDAEQGREPQQVAASRRPDCSDGSALAQVGEQAPHARQIVVAQTACGRDSRCRRRNEGRQRPSGRSGTTTLVRPLLSAIQIFAPPSSDQRARCARANASRAHTLRLRRSAAGRSRASGARSRCRRRPASSLFCTADDSEAPPRKWSRIFSSIRGAPKCGASCRTVSAVPPLTFNRPRSASPTVATRMTCAGPSPRHANR